MKKYFIGVYHPSVILTYIGILISIYGIFLVKSENEAYICLMLAGICDLFDGSIARCFKRSEAEKGFGIQIDSLADIVSFGVFPVSILLKTRTGLFTACIAAFYILTAVTRLAWFNITAASSPKAYTGLPVTYAAFFVPVLYTFCIYSDFPLYPVQCILYISLSILFISNISIKKPGKISMAGFLAAAILIIILIRLKFN